MASEIERVQINDMTSADFFSLALDESTDICNTAQLSIVGHYVGGETIPTFCCTAMSAGYQKGECLHVLLHA